MTPHLPELDRPPFAVVSSLVPAQVAGELVACFQRLGQRPDRLAHAHALAIQSIGAVSERAVADDTGHPPPKRVKKPSAGPAFPGTPLALAGASIARDIDRGVGAGLASGYHNPQHFLEVMLCALYLARTHKLEPLRIARLVTAGLIHDFHHDGSRGATAPFRLELIALEKANPYLQAAALNALECRRLEALVLATEPRAGVPFARACWQQHRTGARVVPAAATLPDALEQLALEPELAFDAVLLAEADVLPSIGLTLDHADALQARLASEWGTPLGREDKLAFIDRMIGEIMVAQFFVPNVQRLRQAYAGGAV